MDRIQERYHSGRRHIRTDLRLVQENDTVQSEHDRLGRAQLVENSGRDGLLGRIGTAAIGGIIAGGLLYGMYLENNSRNTDPATLADCSGEQAIPSGYPTQSEAITDVVPGIDNAEELGSMPVKHPDGSISQYRVYLPQGAPEDALIPQECN